MIRSLARLPGRIPVQPHPASINLNPGECILVFGEHFKETPPRLDHRRFPTHHVPIPVNETMIRAHQINQTGNIVLVDLLVEL